MKIRSFLIGRQKFVRIRQAMLALVATAGILLLGLPLFSQVNQGTIQGAVFDQSGGVIAGATVTILDVARGTSRPLTSDSAGAYVASNLIPGMYTVRGEAKGFQTLERSNILLEVGQTVRVDLVLQPGAQSQTVTITSEAPAIDTTDATLGGTINQETLGSLPTNGRDFKNLIQLRPGVAAIIGGGFDAWSANGNRAEDVGYLVDGIRADEAYTGQSLVNGPLSEGDVSQGLPLDAIQEVDNQENEKAEVGWKPGAVVNVGIKSGTNDLHGSAFAYGRDTSFDARNYFNPPPLPPQAVTLEQFGGSAGWKIRKDKLFWFGAYEGQRYTVDSLSTPTTPVTTLLPGGNTAANVAASFVNACLDLKASEATISPLSAQLAGLNTSTCAVAPTNFTPGPGESLYPTNSVVGTQSILLNTYSGMNNGIGKLDYHINDKQSVSFMYFGGIGGIVFPPASGESVENWPFNTSQGATAELWAGAWTWAISSTRVNELRLGYDHYDQDYHSEDYTVNPLAYGINTGVTESLIFGLPSIAIKGFSSIGGGQRKIIGPDDTFQLVDHYSIVRGNHTVKFGGEFDNNAANSYQNSAGKGTIDFTSLENYLQGIVKSSGNSIFSGNPQRALDNHQFALFAQDDWRVARRVTVNLGLRWEYNSVLTEAHNDIGNFSPTLGLVQVGDQIKSPYDGDFRNFSPRLGVAWDMFGDGKTIFRAGGSLMYSYLPFINYAAVNQSLGLTQVPTGATIVTQGACAAGCAGNGNISLVRAAIPGSSITTAWQNQTSACVTGGTTACGTLFPTSVFKAECGDGLDGDPNPCTIAAFDPNIRTPYIETWTLGIQRAITSGLSLDVSYVGTHGARLPGFVDINQAALGSGFTATQICCATGSGDPTNDSLTAENANRPFSHMFPYLADIDETENVDRSNYNGLQISVTQRAWHGLNFLAGYTFSHSLDDFSTDQFMFVPTNSGNPGGMYGNSDFDLRQRFTWTIGYAIPGLKSPGQMLEGWRVNAVIELQSGGTWSGHDAANDFSGTGEINNPDYFGDGWNFSGKPSDFVSGPLPIDCWAPTGPDAGGAALSNCDLPTEPQPCIAAATAISAATLASLNSTGCYIKGNSVLIPPALGTYGNVQRNMFRDSGFRNLNMSFTKDWKFKERYGAQLKIELFNILNHPNFANPGGIGPGAGYTDPSGGLAGDFGCGCVTPDQAAPNPVLGDGSNRAMQLGLKLSF